MVHHAVINVSIEPSLKPTSHQFRAEPQIKDLSLMEGWHKVQRPVE